MIPLTKNGKLNVKALKPEHIDYIWNLTPFVLDQSLYSLKERYYCVKNNISEHPTCQVCGTKTKFWKTHGCYAKHCSNSCGTKDEEVKEKFKQTCLEKYGVEHSFQADEVKLKSRETCLERYGVENPYQCEEIKETIKQIKLERFGVETFTNRQKAKQTCLERYGVENASESKEIKDKISIAHMKRNAEGTNYSGIVYFLHFPELKAVKIGLSSDLKTRSIALKRDFGSFSIIKLIETEECSKLETYFHEKFAEYRICLEEGCGRTEFFKEDILEFF